MDQGGSGGATQTFGITTATKNFEEISETEVEINLQQTPESTLIHPDPLAETTENQGVQASSESNVDRRPQQHIYWKP